MTTTKGPAATGGGGLAARMLGAWRDLAGSTRAVAEATPGEGRLLFLAMLSGLFWLLGRLAALWLGPDVAAMSEDELSSRVAGDITGALIVRTLALYGLAGLAGLICRRAGGIGGWRDTRAAVFWSALVVAPPLLLLALLTAVLGSTIPALAAVVDILGNLLFAWVLAVALAAVHGFKRPLAVFVVIAGSSLAIILTLRFLGGA